MTATDDQALAPPVVAVVITRDPGDWFETCLASLAAQDYPSLSVLVLDAGSQEPVLPRVAAVLPSAYVRRLDQSSGYGPTANVALEIVEGASFFVFCHDDVALEPDATRLLIEEVFRSNAAIVGPKIVAWDEPDRLLDVGGSVDKGGVLIPFVERMELDQEQHDPVRDVFVVSSSCLVVRADLFVGLDGFDPVIDRCGEDVDLCWRAQVAGGRVVIVPGARVRHRESASIETHVDDDRLFSTRHRLRTVLTCYSRWHLIRVLPQLMVSALAEIVYAIFTRQPARAKAVASAWWWNWGMRRDIRARRQAVAAVRRFPDSEVRRLQVGGAARARRFARGELDRHRRLREELEDLGDELEEIVHEAPKRLAAAAWITAGLIFVIGSRELLFGGLPQVAGFMPIDGAPTDLVRAWTSGWREAGLGATAASPTAFGLVGLWGIVMLGATGVLQLVLVLGTVPLGLLGVWRLTRRLGAPNARAVAVLLYVVVPLPWDAISVGDWAALIAYAVLPWLFDTVISVTADSPSDTPSPPRPIVTATLGRGLFLAVAAAFVPLLPALVVVVGVGIWVGGLITGDWRSTWRAPLVPVALAVWVAVLHLPWTIDLLHPDGNWWAWGGVGWLDTDPVPARQLMSFDTGPIAVAGLGWAIPAAGALALLVGQGWRLRWAVRCWTVAVLTWALTWAGEEGHLGVDVPTARLMLVPAAVALALSGALGVIAFERDLRGFRFGWRQVAPIAAAAAVVLALIPAVLGAVDGRWDLPDDDHAAMLDPILDEDTPGGFRVLWIGHQATMPTAGFRLADDVAFWLTATGTRPEAAADGTGAFPDRWASNEQGATDLVADALDTATRGSTDRLGKLLAAFGVRYVVLVERNAPFDTDAGSRPLPDGLVDTMSRQLDLRPVPFDPSVRVLENVAPAAVRQGLPAGASTALGSVEGSAADDPEVSLAASLVLPPGTGVLDPSGFDRWRGDLEAAELFVATTADSGWHLELDDDRGDDPSRRRVLGWANGWAVPGPGEATLSYETALLRYVALAGQVALWGLVVAWLIRGRGRRRPPLGDEVTEDGAHA